MGKTEYRLSLNRTRLQLNWEPGKATAINAAIPNDMGVLNVHASGTGRWVANVMVRGDLIDTTMVNTQLEAQYWAEQCIATLKRDLPELRVFE